MVNVEEPSRFSPLLSSSIPASICFYLLSLSHNARILRARSITRLAPRDGEKRPAIVRGKAFVESLRSLRPRGRDLDRASASGSTRGSRSATFIPITIAANCFAADRVYPRVPFRLNVRLSVRALAPLYCP
jgi:hypothetical protein